MPDPVQPRPAASVLLIREIGPRLEVLMVERPAHGYFGGLYVFPGGAVDPVDHTRLALRIVSGPALDHEFRAAALREVAEEVGLSVTTRGVVSAPDLRGEELFESFDRTGSRLDGERLVLISRWVTPRQLLGYFPDLEDVEITHAWGGKLGVSFDLIPHMGQIDGIWYALGYAGHGVGLATLLGHDLAGMLLGEEAPSVFTKFPHPTRFYYRGKPWFLTPASLLYRLLDRMGR